ncbi:Monocarboxylate transporter 12-B [Sarcoptes scabiei]|uniref:Monocarboxylate transporter 12-B n=1 Tax=Sarcoptes scabiei TaxID=52283 RepID=A0A834R0M7_SARSC|nr:Monocarboxylate transporter 12-B [Sarcoptes scabiei]
MPPHASQVLNSSSSLPLYHSVLLSISGDSKISLQHTSVQQLSAIPEDRELIDDQNQHRVDDDGACSPIIVEDDFEEPQILIQDPAPDGGYGWIIVMASFFCNLIVDGIAYTFGLFFEIFIGHFATSKSKVALCGSLLNGFYLSVGPLVSSLANRFGCRFVTILGAIIACIAFSLSTVAPNIETLYITYGFLGGVGMGMIFLPAIVSVGYYFTSKRAFATGIAVCGSGVGTFLFAPFCQFLLGVTTWQNTLLILAGMILLCAAFGVLMRPLNVHAETILTSDLDQNQIPSTTRMPLLQRIAEEKRRRLLAHSNSQILLMMQNGELDLNELTFTELKARLSMNMEPGVHSTLYLDQLFQQSPEPSASTHHSQNQLALDKHQLSPILEMKKFSVSPVDESSLYDNDELATPRKRPRSKTIGDKPETSLPIKPLGNGKKYLKELSEEEDEINSFDPDEESSPNKHRFDVDETETFSVTVPESPPASPQSSKINDGEERLPMIHSGTNLNQKTRKSFMRTVSENQQSVVGDSTNFPQSSTTFTSQVNGLGTTEQLPIQVILSTTPTNRKNSNDQNLAKENRKNAQTIPVRPLSKKDIFYSGSTLRVHQSSTHMSESGMNIGQSIVSIPARDIIARVQKQLQRKENENDEIDDGLGGKRKNFVPKKKNVCDKILRILRTLRKDCCCLQQTYLFNDKNKDNEPKSLQSEIQQSEQKDAEDCFDASQTKSPKKSSLTLINHDGGGCWQRFINCLPPSMGSILNEMLDFSLLRESNAFMILAISNIFGMMGFYVPFVYITQFAVSSVKNGDRFVSPDQAAFLISIIGITNTFGRLLFGYLSDQITKNGSIFGIKITALGLNNICVILSGIAIILAPFCTTYFLVIIDCILFGLFISAYVCLTSVILVDMLGLNKLTNAFGLLCLFRGAASMIGPPLAGALFDLSQSYHVTFAVSGSLLIFSSIMAFFISSNQQNQTVDQEPYIENDSDV